MGVKGWGAIVALVFGSAFGQDYGSVPARELETAPKIDGRIEAAEWSQAAVIDQFWDGKSGEPAAFKSVVYLGFDSEALYIAAILSDPEPGKIIAQEKKRDGKVENDDLFAILIDPEDRRRTPYWFQVNPLGTQKLDTPGGNTEVIGWSGDWTANARITESGWELEARIPFRLLRYPSGQTAFGVAFIRSIPRDEAYHVFPNMERFMDEHKHARWTGLRLPDPRRPILIMPYAIGSANRQDGNGRFGLDAKYLMANGSTAQLTVRPDFENILGDVASIDFSYTEKSLSETRPFFQEGAGFFPHQSVFYSLRAREVDAAFKTFGTSGPIQYGALGLTNAGKGVSVGRIQYQFAPQSYVGATGLAGRHTGLDEEVYGADFEYTMKHRLGQYAVYGSHLEYSGAQSGSNSTVNFRYSGPERTLNWDLAFSEVTAGFSPSTAYVPETGFRGQRLFVYWFDRPSAGSILSWTASAYLNKQTRTAGGLLDETARGSLSIRLRSHRSFSLSYTAGNRPPFRDRYMSVSHGWNVLDNYRSGSAFVLIGKQGGGESRYISLEQRWPLDEQAHFAASYERFELTYPQPSIHTNIRLSQLVFTANYDLSEERSIGLRFVGQGESLGSLSSVNNWFVTFLQRARRGADVYFLFGLPNASRTQTRFALKIVTPMELR